MSEDILLHQNAYVDKVLKEIMKCKGVLYDESSEGILSPFETEYVGVMSLDLFAEQDIVVAIPFESSDDVFLIHPIELSDDSFHRPIVKRTKNYGKLDKRKTRSLVLEDQIASFNIGSAFGKITTIYSTKGWRY